MTGRLKDELTAARSVCLWLSHKQQITSQVPSGRTFNKRHWVSHWKRGRRGNRHRTNKMEKWTQTQRRECEGILNLHMANKLHEKSQQSSRVSPKQKQGNKPSNFSVSNVNEPVWTLISCLSVRTPCSNQHKSISRRISLRHLLKKDHNPLVCRWTLREEKNKDVLFSSCDELTSWGMLLFEHKSPAPGMCQRVSQQQHWRNCPQCPQAIYYLAILSFM